MTSDKIALFILLGVAEYLCRYGDFRIVRLVREVREQLFREDEGKADHEQTAA